MSTAIDASRHAIAWSRPAGRHQTTAGTILSGNFTPSHFIVISSPSITITVAYEEAYLPRILNSLHIRLSSPRAIANR